MKEPEQLHLQWRQYADICGRMCRRFVAADCFGMDMRRAVLVPVVRGGLFPGYLMGYALERAGHNCPVQPVQMRSYDGQQLDERGQKPRPGAMDCARAAQVLELLARRGHGELVVVEDIVDSGATASALARLWRRAAPDGRMVVCAAVVRGAGRTLAVDGAQVPLCSGMELQGDAWVMFPGTGDQATTDADGGGH